MIARNLLLLEPYAVEHSLKRLGANLRTGQSTALYWHSGATTMRFGGVSPGSRSGSNNLLLIEEVSED